MTTIHCPKCHASAGSLEARVEHLEAGAVLQVVRCLICNWRIEREAPRPAVQLTAEDVALKAAGLARTAAHKSAAAEARCRVVEAGTKPCAIAGCSGTYFAPTSHSPLCKRHRLALYSWTGRARKGRHLAPPLLCVNGHWIERGAPLPGIPGEKPAPAWDAEAPAAVGAPLAAPLRRPRSKRPLRPAGTSPTSQGRPRGGQKPCPTKSTPGLEADLFQLARRGHKASRALLVALEDLLP